jgi:hypothetical protein
MDTKDKVNEEQKARNEGSEVPLGGAQKISEMMKSCCGSGDIRPDCRSMMARMMGSDKSEDKGQGSATGTASKEG